MSGQIRINLLLEPEDGAIYEYMKAVQNRRRAERAKRVMLLGIVAERGAVGLTTPVGVTAIVPSAADEGAEPDADSRSENTPATNNRRGGGKVVSLPGKSTPSVAKAPSAANASGPAGIDDAFGDDFVNSALGFQGVGR